MKRPPKTQIVDWLSDLSWVPNGAVVFISAASAAVPAKKAKHNSSEQASAAVIVTNAHEVKGNKPDSTLLIPTKSTGSDKAYAVKVKQTTAGDGAGNDEVTITEDEDEDEVLAMAALNRIRDSYKRRARVRETGTGHSSAGREVAQEEASRRMLEKRRVTEQTDRFRQVGIFRILRREYTVGIGLNNVIV